MSLANDQQRLMKIYLQNMSSLVHFFDIFIGELGTFLSILDAVRDGNSGRSRNQGNILIATFLQVDNFAFLGVIRVAFEDVEMFATEDQDAFATIETFDASATES
jgi:hypothetical protein